MNLKKLPSPIVFVAILVLFNFSCSKKEVMSVSNVKTAANQESFSKVQTLNSVNNTSNNGNPEIQVQAVTSAITKTQLKNAFLNLSGVNLAELSSELGLPYVLNVDSIDFVNVQMSWDTIDVATKAVSANFKHNTNSWGYCFTMYIKGSSAMQQPTIVKVAKDIYLQYFNLSEGLVTTVNNYSKPSYAFSSTQGRYMTSNAPNLNAPRVSRGCGQKSMNCFLDAYSNHGWVSLWATIQTAFIPQTAVAIAGACISRNCLTQ